MPRFGIKEVLRLEVEIIILIKLIGTIQSSLILRYIHLNKIQFVQFYLITIVSIIRTFIKSLYFKLLGKQNLIIMPKQNFWVGCILING